MFELSGVGIASAFAAGLISFLSPCVLPLVPGYLSYVADQSVEDLGGERTLGQRIPVVLLSLWFVLGFSTVFVALGASATAIGQWLFEYKYQLSVAGGVIITVFGLFMLGWLRLPVLQRDVRYHGALRGGKPVSAYLLGLAFAFGWTPCIGPILGAILTVSANSGSVSQGVGLLAIYAAGLGVPFLLAAYFADWFIHHASRMRRWVPWIHRGAGAVLVIVGIAMATGYLSRFSFWLLEYLPWLAELG